DTPLAVSSDPQVRRPKLFCESLWRAGDGVAGGAAGKRFFRPAIDRRARCPVPRAGSRDAVHFQIKEKDLADEFCRLLQVDATRHFPAGPDQGESVASPAPGFPPRISTGGLG